MFLFSHLSMVPFSGYLQIRHRPFDALIMIEPVIFKRPPHVPPPQQSPPLSTNESPSQPPQQQQKPAVDGPKQRTTMAASRRSTFPSLQAAHDQFASRPFFKPWHPDALNLYVSDGLYETGNEYKLKTTPAEEAATFSGGLREIDLWGWPRLAEIDIPTLLLTGKNSHHLNLKVDDKNGNVV